MNLRTFQIFAALCENGCHVTRTAEILHMAQPAVSNTVKELESYYGVKLFDRFGKKLVITPAGKRLLDYSKMVMSGYDELEKELRNWDTLGELRIGASSSIGAYFLPRLLTDFMEEYPDLRITVQINESSVLEEMILDNRIDLALTEGTVHHEEIKSETFMEDELALISSSRRFDDGKILTVEELQKVPFLIRDRESGTREAVLSKFREAGILPDIRIESVSTEAILQCVYQDLGIAAVPMRIANKAHDTGKASIIGSKGMNMKRRYLLICHRNKFLSRSALNFIDRCRSLECK